MITDPIADLLVRIKNAYFARGHEVVVPYSSVKEAIVRILVKNHYVVSYVVRDEEGAKKNLVIALNDMRTAPYIPSFRRISKPGQRIYLGAKDIRKSRNGFGIFILSTPKGVVTGYEARSLNVGGELLCEIY